jgi:SOS-response transcriptional repressor LexA
MEHPGTIRGREMREQIVSFVSDYMAEHGWSPSYQEIAAELDLVDRGTVHAHLHRLADEGRIVLGGGPRQIRVVGNIRSHQ